MTEWRIGVVRFHLRRDVLIVKLRCMPLRRNRTRVAWPTLPGARQLAYLNFPFGKSMSRGTGQKHRSRLAHLRRSLNSCRSLSRNSSETRGHRFAASRQNRRNRPRRFVANAAKVALHDALIPAFPATLRSITNPLAPVSSISTAEVPFSLAMSPAPRICFRLNQSVSEIIAWR